MTARLRVLLTVLSAGVLAAVMGWGVAGLPDFGHYLGPYGDLISHLAHPQREIANSVAATVFDYRGFDTLGEEMILLAAASATAMLLRAIREETVDDVVDRVRSDAVRAVGAVTAILTLVLGLDVVSHGLLTPGGGFQGGVLLSAAFAFVFLAIEYRAYNEIATDVVMEPLEGLGAAAFVGFGIAALLLGLAFLQNVMAHDGTYGTLTGGGSIPFVNWAAGIAVTCAFVVVYGEYLQEAMAGRHK